ncbi:glycosyltransferase [Bradyrhizobium sediminis]|uniref:Glycosyltransferase n=1 Tax=Bradyrhizobium sediminis TaxID=2840469 RepID=A0A975RMI0_9BRAD|nr:glycosyltransferase [Bradyrhizobium sediminis]QWG12526.1 glycosyltransferase [Bradyrhizobium sediminis]
MTSEPAYQALFLGAGPQMQCGVGHFTRLLQDAIEKLAPGSCGSLTLTRSEGTAADIWRAVGSARSVVCNFPIVAWKRVIFRPLLALAIARLRRRRVVLVQHEWGGLHWLRRITYIPALLLADTILMFSPLVRRELADDPVVGWTLRKCILAPLPPNIEAPAGIADSKLRQRLAAAREQGRLVIGHFGSIYPGKQPNALLQIGAILKERGLDPLIVYVGSFIRGVDTVEDDFYARAAELGIIDDVIVSGYVASDHEVFGLFSEIDAFCYPLDEGLTARRSSILTCVQSGRPLIVTGPALPDEFDHHPRFKELIDRGAIVLVARGSEDEVYADRIAAALKWPSVQAPFDFDGWWLDVAQAVRAQLAVVPGRE